MTTETILEIETSLDDCSPQLLGYVLERALELGALDAYTTPAQMKKNRPGTVVTLLARPAERAALVELLLRETTTLGVRVAACERTVLEREIVTVETRFGTIAVKVARGGGAAGGFPKAMPEFEDCRAAARRCRAPLREVTEAALAAWRAKT